MALSTRYFERMRLDPTSLDAEPTLAKLKQLQETHLRTIPFENTAQHGIDALGLPTLDLDTTAKKILDCRRGGFCYELNHLFGAFLTELDYQVAFVPAVVEGAATYPTHMILIVRCNDNQLYYADVGFGEPPLHPLTYNPSEGAAQQTPEGMVSKFSQGQAEDEVVMWWRKDGEWKARLRWKHRDTQTFGKNEDTFEIFQNGLDMVLSPPSIFSQKLIVCLLTDKQKVTLAGHKLKITGPPRFANENVDLSEVESDEAAREVLEKTFGIPMEHSDGLALDNSLNADPNIWAHQ